MQYGVVPDHLALLPRAVGVCSWADGCGAPRANEGTEPTMTEPLTFKDRLKAVFRFLGNADETKETDLSELLLEPETPELEAFTLEVEPPEDTPSPPAEIGERMNELIQALITNERGHPLE